MKYYICDACKFQFVRRNEVEKCPDCGKEAIRLANDYEISEFNRIQKDLNKELNWK